MNHLLFLISSEIHIAAGNVNFLISYILLLVFTYAANPSYLEW